MNSGLRSAKSPVWDYYIILPEDSTKAKCKLCSVCVSRGGVGKKATTTALLNHLKKKHKNDYKTKTNTDDDDDDSHIFFKDIAAGPSTSHGLKRKQTTLAECFEKKKLWDINHPKSIELHYAIGEMIALDNQPYSIVNDVGFTNLVRKMQPQYNIPSSKYFKEKIIPNIFQKCTTDIDLQIAAAKTISLTSDIWTSVNNHSFFSFIGHWITEEFQQRSAVLNVKFFPGTHSGATISTMLTELINKWNIKNRVHVLLRDNAANIIKGANDANLNNESCFIHTLQLSILDAINSQRAVKDIIAVSRNIVSHFNHSSLACSNLKNIQINELKITVKKLVQDVSTRWNSTYYMLERLLEMKNAVSLYATQYGGITNLKAEQWVVLESCLSLLQPFEEITKIISSKHSIISEVIPTVATLEHYLSKDDKKFFGVNTMKLTLKESILKRFENLCDNDNFTFATLLDPRYKTAFFKKETGVNDYGDLIKLKILHEMKKIITSEGEKSNPQKSNIEAEVETQSPSVSQSIHTSFWNCFNEITHSSTTNAANSNALLTDSATQQATQELNFYLTSQPFLILRNEDPLQWWGENRKKYPTLAKLARIYLSAPASSIYSERLFSEAGNIYEKKRNRLLPETAETLVFLHHNLPLIKNYK